jgi:hypothetical protein
MRASNRTINAPRTISEEKEEEEESDASLPKLVSLNDPDADEGASAGAG